MSASIQGGLLRPPRASTSRRRGGQDRSGTSPCASRPIAGLAIIAFFVLVALLSPILVTGDPKEKVGPIFGPPSASYLGLDGGGANMVELLIAGTRVSLLVGFCAASSPRSSAERSARPRRLLRGRRTSC